ncbi:hypothetical protein M9H77_35021 [Catharanthus roseus]|uniref:Uncharacterized protein n=1 Tax=Catharanthus roseus TaxID=4058 RepID=A0ACB9ZQD8_CATRO|nr:hypothetical protein M9H77_35021 [Catharanthus roseus]
MKGNENEANGINKATPTVDGSSRRREIICGFRVPQTVGPDLPCAVGSKEVPRHKAWHEDNLFEDYGENSNIGQIENQRKKIGFSKNNLPSSKNVVPKPQASTYGSWPKKEDTPKLAFKDNSKLKGRATSSSSMLLQASGGGYGGYRSPPKVQIFFGGRLHVGESRCNAVEQRQKRTATFSRSAFMLIKLRSWLVLSQIDVGILGAGYYNNYWGRDAGKSGRGKWVAAALVRDWMGAFVAIIAVAICDYAYRKLVVYKHSRLKNYPNIVTTFKFYKYYLLLVFLFSLIFYR